MASNARMHFGSRLSALIAESRAAPWAPALEKDSALAAYRLAIQLLTNSGCNARKIPTAEISRIVINTRMRRVLQKGMGATINGKDLTASFQSEVSGQGRKACGKCPMLQSFAGSTDYLTRPQVIKRDDKLSGGMTSYQTKPQVTERNQKLPNGIRSYQTEPQVTKRNYKPCAVEYESYGGIIIYLAQKQDLRRKHKPSAAEDKLCGWTTSRVAGL